MTIQMVFCKRCDSAVRFEQRNNVLLVIEPCSTCSVPPQGNVQAAAPEVALKPEMTCGLDKAARREGRPK